MNYGGYNTGWRLPTPLELQSIVDYGHYPSIDTTVFPGTPADYFWSSSIYVYDTAYAWSVTFDYGTVYSSDKAGTYYVRCVRSGT